VGPSWNSCCDPSRWRGGARVGQWRELPIWGRRLPSAVSCAPPFGKGDLLQGVQPLAATGPAVRRARAPAVGLLVFGGSVAQDQALHRPGGGTVGQPFGFLSLA